MVVVSADARRAYVTNIGSGTTTAIDLVEGRKLGDIATGAGSEALALDTGRTGTLGGARADGTITIVDTAILDGEGAPATSRCPDPDRHDPDGRTALITCAGAGELVAFDVAITRERRRAKVAAPLAADAAARPFARPGPGERAAGGLLVARDGRSAYVAATMADRVVPVRYRTLEVLRTVDVGGEPDGLGSTPAIPRAACPGCLLLSLHRSIARR